MITFVSAADLSAGRELITASMPRLRSTEISTVEICDILQHAHNLLQFGEAEEDQNLGLSVICHVADNLASDPMVRALLSDCINASRNFLYHRMIDQRYGESWNPLSRNAIELLSEVYYRRDDATTLTKQQAELLREFGKASKMVVSAPTSFGKTRLLQEIILEHGFKRIALVMPTLALIAETVRRFRADERFARYTIVSSVNVPPGPGQTIFVLTPEKLDLLLDDNEGLELDFFAMDEVYKIQDADDRQPVFANVLYRLSTSVSHFYLIGPYFKAFSERYLKRMGASFRHFSLEIVQKEEIRLFAMNPGDVVQLDDSAIEIAKTHDTTLKRIVKALKDQQLIYQSTKLGTESVAKKLARISDATKSIPLIDYIKAQISEEWSLVTCLQRGVAFHHGAMPRYIQAELVDQFNRNEIRTLVCTTTLTEGVNTTAKNVILFSNKKGEALLTGFDFKNIKGRAGRFLHHFVGRVISFYEIDEQERDVIEFNYLDEENLSSDEVLSVEADDLRPKALKKREAVIQLLEQRRVPTEVVRRNKYIPIEKQLVLVDLLRSNPDILRGLAFAGNLPKKDQLDAIMDLCQQYLFNKRDFEDQTFPIGNLKRLTNYYIYRKPTLKELIAAQDGKTADTRIRHAFSLISHYFEFSWPKYLICFESLFNFVAVESKLDISISLSFLITMLQYGFTEPHQIAMKDAGLPDEVINKLSARFEDCRSIQEIRYRAQIEPDVFEGLSDFERELFTKVL